MSKPITLNDLQDTPVAVSVTDAFKPSPYQQAIFDEVRGSMRNLRVEAVAGSGKTTTMSKAAALLNRRQKIKFMVFSKANQLDMVKKVPDWVTATTAHAAGFADIRRAYRGVKVDEKKMWNLLRDRYAYDNDVKTNGGDILKLVSLCKNTLKQPSEQNLDWLCERFGIAPNGNQDIIYPAAQRLFEDSLDLARSVIDYDDMIYLPAMGEVRVEQADVLVVDEAQDTNPAQQAYYLNAVGGGNGVGRMIFVGDTKQAIFGFRGADVEAMNSLSHATMPRQLPLSICYRCPSRVVALAQAIVPQIQPRENAPDGIVGDLDYALLATRVQRGNMVLCRNNAPLVKPAFDLIRRGIKAVIRGRDIGRNLIVFVRRAQKQSFASDLSQVIAWLSDYVAREEVKLLSAHKDNQAQMLNDQLETIIALSDGCYSMSDLERRIETVFSDEVEGVVFSTVHKAKGLEAERVFILKPDLLNPQKYDKQEWQVTQLRNLKYVAITRSLAELYFVQGGD